MSVTMQGRFWTNICILVWIYFNKNMRVLMAVFTETAEDQCPKIAKIFCFLGGGGGGGGV